MSSTPQSIDELVTTLYAGGWGDGDHLDGNRPALSDWRSVLDLEVLITGWPELRRAAAIRAAFAVSVTRYTVALLRAIECPEALLYAPALVARLQRLRDERRRLRAAGRVDQDRMPRRPAPEQLGQRHLDLARRRS